MRFTIAILLLISIYISSLSNSKSKLSMKHYSSTRKHKHKLQIYKHCTKPNTIALTFDDGPENTTEQHIDYFTKRNIKVTFFFVAKHLLNPEKLKLVQKAFDAGHEIGNHTFDHPSLVKIFESKTRIADLKKQLIYSSELFKKGLGVVPRYFRPPYGKINKSAYHLLRKLGFKVFLWNLDTKDWDWDARKVIDKLAIVKAFRKAFNKRPYVREFISLQHEKSTNPEAELERIDHIVDMILSRGYKIVKLSECIQDNIGPYRDAKPSGDLIEEFFINYDTSGNNLSVDDGYHKFFK
jgi:peptidoglycan/xylan/chitin deacetylase (PgdA/CDA1 family)